MTALSFDGTPYILDDTAVNGKRVSKLIERSDFVRERALTIGRTIQVAASDIFGTFGMVLRSELTAESNTMERQIWSASEVRQVVTENRDLLDLPIHSFLESVRADERLYEALGLYRAQVIADEWAMSDHLPRQHEIRELHSIITAGKPYAGNYRTRDIRIGGTVHVPPSAAEAADGMRSLSDWWREGTGDPLVDGAVVHAWLTHIHPFEDGNGRLARLLANMTLSRLGYPPLIIRAGTDRGEYYDALAASDEGDILPLTELFGRVLRRTVRVMGRPSYVEDVLQDRLLTEPDQRYKIWVSTIDNFFNLLRRHLSIAGWNCLRQGVPSAASFEALNDLDLDGNSWFAKVVDPTGRPVFLLWFGFHTVNYREVFTPPSNYPSVFVSVRTSGPGFEHPYTRLSQLGIEQVPEEWVVRPVTERPVAWQRDGTWTEETLDAGARELAHALQHWRSGSEHMAVSPRA